MKINVESFISLDTLLGDFAAVEEKMQRYGEVIVCRRDMPMYRLSAIREERAAKCTLSDAMERVLVKAPGKRLHASEFTAKITEQGLYFMKSGAPVSAVQVRARASGTPEKFECEKGNYIKLKGNAQ